MVVPHVMTLPLLFSAANAAEFAYIVITPDVKLDATEVDALV
jgi:hypothetical protein